mmetsp:Transcript_13430/g.31581  ORF Transcript_13430/g.31581 Transcript_13430/m.31581 type:complete len:119 (+) Transcript_13430:513-869(+)
MRRKGRFTSEVIEAMHQVGIAAAHHARAVLQGARSSDPTEMGGLLPLRLTILAVQAVYSLLQCQALADHILSSLLVCTSTTPPVRFSRPLQACGELRPTEIAESQWDSVLAEQAAIGT